ncbi:MAG TPA: carboxypeptidase M32 [Solirubrobacteraceae bacterium]|nr:carboxypeptidase M32 [Solirubrobacteraceae bacterium]
MTTVEAPPALTALRERLAELSDLGRAGALLRWDQETKMPPGAAAERAEQIATLERIAHERLVDERLGELLEELLDHERALPHDDDEASLIRVARTDREKAVRVPSALVAEMARASSEGQLVWRDARDASDFALLVPALERNVALARQYAACFPDAERPYDALLDDHEPGMRTAEAEAVLGPLRAGLVPLLEEVQASPTSIGKGPLHGPLPVARQRTLVTGVLAALGVEARTWRTDDTRHPFAMAAAGADVRLTTRYAEEDLDSLFAAIHEFGHGLYEHAIAPSLWRTPLAHGVSSAVHESQSRLWENFVGRSEGFWRWCFPRLRDAFPERYGQADWRVLHRAANAVAPSLIRTSADELTYGLHVAVRFELELALFDGSLEVRDLREGWNARYRQYLGIEVPSDALGVLQDVHWPAGLFGYFPTYALGNVLAAQLWERIGAELPDLDERFAAGDFAPLREWLRERVHRHGRKFTAGETIERAAGGPLDPGPFLAYLRRKLTPLYGL